jgi:Protein of unknown function (DUF1173)
MLGRAMDPCRYFVKGRTYSVGDPLLQGALARVYSSSERPRCMCVAGGVEMYIAKHAEYVIKRMPETGAHHHPTCPSFEPEFGFSGLGELMGEAIVEIAPEQVEVRTDFPMVRLSGRGVARGDGGETLGDPPQVEAPRKRMSMRALLHFLYERAGLNRWYPAMLGRRNQGVLCKYLTAASQGVLLKGVPLEERTYVPEPFRVDAKQEIGDRRRRKLALLLSPGDDLQFKMAIVIGEFNGSEVTPYGRKVLVKHMPDAPLYIDTKTWERAQRSYAQILQACDGDVARKPRVLMAALIYAKREHTYQIDTLTMMLVTDQWLPLDGIYELPLIEELQREGRSFFKPMKYDARSGAAFPNVLLLDCEGAPLPLHVVSPFASAGERTAKSKTIAAADAGTWVWHTEAEMPSFPIRSNAAARKTASDSCHPSGEKAATLRC